MNHRRLCIAGGGTGGHVMPALAIADAVRQRWPHVAVDFIGAERGLEARLLPARGEQVQLLPMHALQGKGMVHQLKVLGWDIPRAIWRVLRSWRNNKPDLLLGVGGYASVNGVLAALLARVPVVLYEQNAMPGMVNRRLAVYSQQVMLGFAAAAEYLPGAVVQVTGNIVRQEIAAVSCTPHIPPRLLVMGGSQGARFLNEHVPLLCAALHRKGRVFSVHHLCGSEQQCAAVQQRYDEAGVHAQVDAFCENMADFYRQGDVLIARAGAMTVSEVLACHLPTVFIPLPSAADQHQYHNARQLEAADAALLLDQQAYNEEKWSITLDQMLFDPMRLMHMRQLLQTMASENPREAQLAVLAPWLESV